MFASSPILGGALVLLSTTPGALASAPPSLATAAEPAAAAVPQRGGGAPERKENPVRERINIPGGPLEVPPGHLVIVGDLFLKNPKSAPFLLLVHGARSSRGEFRKVGPILNELGYNCLAIDLRVGGRMNYVRNQTSRQLTQHGVTANVLATIPDIETSLAYVREHWAEGPLLCLGSAVSATLSMHIAAESPELLDGLLLFSPPLTYFEQFGKPADWALQLARKLKCPTFLTGLRSSEGGLQSVYDALDTERKMFFLPETRGVHGARALWPEELRHPQYWGALTKFLEAHFSPPDSASDSSSQPLVPGPTEGELRLPAIFSDGVVLQRESNVRLWGWAGKGAAVTLEASWSESPLHTEADGDGRFRFELPTPSAEGPHEIMLRSGAETHVIHNVWSGEVWLCSGQSNMEWSVGPHVGPGIRNFEAELEAADLDKLHFFNVTNAVSPFPRDDCEGVWQVSDADTARVFSATAFFFGRELLEELDCPIGLVETDWGGTLCEAWTSPKGLEAFPEFQSDLGRMASLARDPGAAERELQRAVDAWWEALRTSDPGSGEARFMNADLADDGWNAMPLPAQWERADEELAGFDGVMWFRRSFELSAGDLSEEEFVLELGPIDDMDTTWLNGRRIGGHESYGQWRAPRRYSVPAGLLREGRNVVAVRVLDTGGDGGIYGESQDLALKGRGGVVHSLAGSWRYRAGADLRTVGRPPARGWLHQNRPTALFNGMLAPLVPLSVRGVIWYQGESNRPLAEQYVRLFPALIADWRRLFQQPDLPFYFVQIAPFNYGGDVGEAALLRDAQRRALALANTGMAVTMDIGNPQNIHPENKQDVGKRLALWALAKDYGRDDLAYSGPLVSRIDFEGGKVRIAFEYANGLTSRGLELEHFTLSGSDGVYHSAVANIDGESVVVFSEDVARPTSVRFGGGAGDETCLWNGAGLPASSFVSDVP